MKRDWISAYRALQNLGKTPSDADAMLLKAHNDGQDYDGSIEVRHFPSDDTFTVVLYPGA